MSKNKILNGLYCCAIAVSLIGCSSTKTQKVTTKVPAAVKQQVQVKTKNVKVKKPQKADKSIEELAIQLQAQERKKQEVARVAQARQRAIAKQRYDAAKRQRAAKQRPAVNRIARARPAARPVRRITQSRPSYRAARRAPVKKVRYASLQGDYAGNPQTVAFINMMASQHGFDRGYLNYLFSNAQLTPFLQRMSYGDTYGHRKKKRKSRAGRWNRYRSNFLTEKTISKGLQFWRQNRVALQRAEDIYGVPQEYILGIIGVETRYGGNVGKNRAIDALAAMGFNNPRRGRYFQEELENYLLMARRSGLDPLRPMASYAGALGLCQFMPSNIKRYGVDFDGKGGINLWTAPDAIASVANYFSKHGWRRGGTVAVPAMATSRRYRVMKTGYKSRHSLSRLRNRGIVASNMGNISGKASLIKLNTYDGDELWIGGKNFYVITRYNHSSHYAMAVHQLAQAIKSRIGGRGIIRQASIEVPASLL